MSGHSKWNNIKRKKEKTDGAKAAVFTRFAREIAVAVKEGGGMDPANNGKLRDVIAKAKASNVPNENIQRAIKKAGSEDKNNYEGIMYEGYGPSGVAVMVSTLTDSRNRTAANLRHYFDKYGASLGANGCVSYLFSHKGVLLVPAEGLDEEKLMEDCFDVGAEDFDLGEEYAEITTAPENLHTVREALEAKGYTFAQAEDQYIPSTTTTLSDPDDLKRMGQLLDALEEDEDVQDFWHNMENEEDLDR
ncbi:MAG: YebC/PmpR family DNA-binding transcriptional regulator [Pygmaiobacter massiliensis]|nr:YebC/PmpR family DNA-binding transcriptional regulator [Pygmaiobacter massiliensis]